MAIGVSIHRLLRAWPPSWCRYIQNQPVSIHRLLRAWPALELNWRTGKEFRSTGSYEPDLQYPPLHICLIRVSIHRLLRAWPWVDMIYQTMYKVSIHRLLRAWPKWSRCAEVGKKVSIHRLLRAWPAKIHGFRVFFTLLFIQIIQIWYLILSLNQNPLQFTPKSRCEPPTEFMFTSGSHW